MSARRFSLKLCLYRVWLCLVLLAYTACFGQSYTITDLGSNAWSYSEAHGLNASGQVVGEYEPTNFFYVLAFLFQNGSLVDIGHLSGTPYAIAYGVNATNVVGESSTARDTHAFRYDIATQTMTDLGTLAGLTGYSSAHAINGAGQIVGESSVSFNQASTIHAVLYDGSSTADLGALGGDYSSANAINNAGVVVGESDVVSQGVTNVHAFEYSNKSLTDLGTLGGDYSSAKGINDAGVIVGEADALIGGVNYTHAFIFHNGTMSDLGTLGGSSSSASAINTAGWVVGYAMDTNEVSNAFLYDGSRMINLNDYLPPNSGWTNLSSADAINDAGQIAGSGLLADGSYHAFLLTPSSPLNVTITNPAPNSSFQAPATFSLGVSAWDSDGSVTNVEFLLNRSRIADSPLAPYSTTVSSLGAGVYILSAIAWDNAGLTATNSITITVTAVVADAPPTVSITNPVANATFVAPATFSIGASASDSDGTVTNVQFLVNGAVIGNSASGPYSVTAANLSAGTYTLQAIASDNVGLTATNAISVTVTNGSISPITLLNPGFESGIFGFSLVTQVGVNYEAQSVTPLGMTNNWTTFTNFVGNGSTVRVSDSSSAPGQKYYRVVGH